MRIALAVVLLLTACSSGAAGNSSSASCAAPVVTVTPASAAPGENVQVQGKYFMDSCADTNDVPPMHPLTRMAVVLRSEPGAEVELGRVDAAGELAAFEVTLRIPADAAEGAGQIEVGEAHAALRIESAPVAQRGLTPSPMVVGGLGPARQISLSSDCNVDGLAC